MIWENDESLGDDEWLRENGEWLGVVNGLGEW